jgi:NhaP-type Na+/H+ or K+/H+ antiporter
MTFDNDPKNKIQAIKKQIEAEKLGQVVKLSQRNLLVTIILSAILPMGGYIYTRRWLSLLGFMLGGFALSVAVHAIEPEQEKAGAMAGSLCMLYGSIVAPIDNARAIARARERVTDLSQ